MSTEYALPGQHELPLEAELAPRLTDAEGEMGSWLGFMSLAMYELSKLPAGNYRWRDLKAHILDAGVKDIPGSSGRHWGALATRLKKHTTGWTRMPGRTGFYIKSSPSCWQAPEDAPLNRSVIVLTDGGAQFKAALIPDAGQNEAGEACNLWAADETAVGVPACWTDGFCWAVNEDGKPSDPVRLWREPVR